MGVQETAPAVQTLNRAGSAGWSCKRITVGGFFFFGSARRSRGWQTRDQNECLLTDGRQRGSRRLHTGAVVQYVSVGTGADRSTGAEQTEPFAFLPVTRVIH